MIETNDVTAARGGDPDAFARLVRRYAAPICAIATAIVGNPRAGEDIAQEAFVRSWRRIGGLDDPARFGPWLRGIARNLAIDAIRSRSRRREVGDGGELAEVADEGLDPGERMDAVRRETAVWDALAALEEEQREVIVLFHRQGRSIREVAQQLEISEPAARKRLSRARGRLREDVMGVLGREIERTAPKGALVVAIVAAVAAEPAWAVERARPRVGSASSPWVAASSLVGGLVVGMLAWVTLPCTAGNGPGEPRPAQTRSGRTAMQQRAFPPVAMASPSAGGVDAERVSLRVQPGQWRSPDSAPGLIQMFAPNRFWPTLDEAPFPRGRKIAALVDHVASWSPSEPFVTDWIVSKTRSLRTAALPDDPWGALVALEVERIGAHHDRYEEERALVAAHDLPDPRRDSSAYYDALRSRSLDAPPMRFGTLLSLARHAGRAWPDHPVADYAALYEIESLAHPMADTRDGAELTEAVMSLLERSSDPYVLDAAIGQLGAAGSRATLTLDDLDLLRAHYDDPEAEIPRYAVSSIALRSALEAGDDDRAAAWMKRFDRDTDALIEEIRARSDASVGLPSLDRTREAYGGWLVARGVREPGSWQSALLASVHRCWHDGHGLEATLTAEGRYDGGGWVWSGWSAEPSFAACLRDAPWEGPEPELGTVVQLEVLAP